MKKHAFYFVSSLVVGSAFAYLFLTPKKSCHYAFTVDSKSDKKQIEKELTRKFKIVREFPDFHVFVLESHKPTHEVQKILKDLGHVELVSTHQIKLLNFFGKILR